MEKKQNRTNSRDAAVGSAWSREVTILNRVFRKGLTFEQRLEKGGIRLLGGYLGEEYSSQRKQHMPRPCGRNEPPLINKGRESRGAERNQISERRQSGHSMHASLLDVK